MRGNNEFQGLPVRVHEGKEHCHIIRPCASNYHELSSMFEIVSNLVLARMAENLKYPIETGVACQGSRGDPDALQKIQRLLVLNKEVTEIPENSPKDKPARFEIDMIRTKNGRDGNQRNPLPAEGSAVVIPEFILHKYD